MLFPWLSLAVAGAWLLVAGFTVAGRRRTAAALAWLATSGPATVTLADYPDNPPSLVAQWPLIVLCVTVAACLTLPAASQPIRQILGTRLIALFGATAAAAGSSLLIEALLFHVPGKEFQGSNYRLPLGLGNTTFAFGHSWHSNFPGPLGWVDSVGPTAILIYAAFIAVMIRVLVKVGGPIRRRLLALIAVPLTMAVVVHDFYSGFAASSMQFWPTPVLLAPGEWLGLLVLPLLALAVGVIVVRGQDAREHLVALGRERAIREEPSPEEPIA